jgi:hypothetical protein
LRLPQLPAPLLPSKHRLLLYAAVNLVLLLLQCMQASLLLLRKHRLLLCGTVYVPLQLLQGQLPSLLLPHKRRLLLRDTVYVPSPQHNLPGLHSHHSPVRKGLLQDLLCCSISPWLTKGGHDNAPVCDVKVDVRGCQPLACCSMLAALLVLQASNARTCIV